MKIQPVVEGHGDAEAVPVLLRRIAANALLNVEVLRPIRIPRSKLVKDVEVERVVQLAAKFTGPDDAILIVFDADDDCPAEIGRRLIAAAQRARSDRAVAVVLAKQEFEAWFLAAVPSLVACGKLPAATQQPDDPESVRDAKGWLGRAMGRRYSETVDQPAFAALFDWSSARAASSLDKFVRDVLRLIAVR